MNILLTGGAGYIGSHTFIAMREAGFEPVILDNFANSHPVVLERLERITGRPVALKPLARHWPSTRWNGCRCFR